MKKMTRVVSLLLAVVMVLSMAVLPASAAGFRDVKTDAWYAEAVDYVTARGYMAGTGEDTFAPNAAVTRAMFVTVLAKMAGAEIDNDVHPFEDVPAGTWYSGAVAWAAEQGIVSGTGAGKFSPDKNITRQDMSLILANFVMATGYKLPQEGLKSFTDADKISAYAREAVDYGTSAGLMSGYSDGTFRPAATATRAQLAVIVMALDKKVQALDAEPVPMPAQSFEKTASGIAVGVKAPVGAVPAGTELQLGRVTDTDYLDVIGTRTGADVIGAVDISFLKDGAELEPERAVEVEISMAGLEAVENPAVVHIRDDGSLEYVSAEVVSTRGSGKSLKFSAKDFSVYAIIEGSNPTDDARLFVHFKQVNGNEEADDIVIPVKKTDMKIDTVNGVEVNHFEQVLYDPGVGRLTGRQSFFGWTTKEDYTEADTENGKTIADVRTDVAEILNGNPGVTDGDTKDYYPMIFDVYSVTYLDEDGACIKTESVLVKFGTTKVYTIKEEYDPKDTDSRFEGWGVAEQNTDGKWVLPEEASMTKYAVNDTLTFGNGTGNDLVLRAFVPKGHWLIFKENGQNASFTPAAFYRSNVTVEPEEPSRFGYEFGGWYKEAACTTPFTFGQVLTETTRVYAKWNPVTTASYTVVIWQQKTTGEEYDFAESVSLSGTTGTTIDTVSERSSGTNAYARIDGKDYQYTGFYLKEFDQNVTITPEGTTVLNVYYDRREYTLTFRQNQNSGTVYKTITARYQASIGSNFPISANGDTTYRWEPHNSSTFNQVLVYIDIMPAENITFTRNYSTASTKYMEFYVEALPGQTGSRTFNGKSFVQYESRIPAKYNFFTEAEDFPALKGYAKYGSDPAFVNGRADVSGGGTIYLYYTRDEYTISCVDGIYRDGDNNPVENVTPRPNAFYTSDAIQYQASVASMKDTINAEAAESALPGFVLEGWYLDKTCTSPFSFDSTMPSNNVTIYAKWIRVQYRVFLYPNATDKNQTGVGTNDPSFSGGEQGTCFRIDWGEELSINGMHRDEYDFSGWYTDPSLGHAYAFSISSFAANDEKVTTPYDRTESTERNYYGDIEADTNKDAVNNRFWITRKLELYAKWREKLVGTDGITVVYESGADGHFADNTTTFTDPLRYEDTASAVAQAAATANTEGKEFKHWVLYEWNGTAFAATETTVLPGKNFDIHSSQAQIVDNDTGAVVPAGTQLSADGSYTYTIKLVAEYGDIEAPTPTHIYWYANNTTEGVQINQPVYINVGVDIPTTDNWVNGNRDGEGTLFYYGHEFLGWTRVVEEKQADNSFKYYKVTDSGLVEITKNDSGVFEFTEDDVFVRWVEASGEGEGAVAAHYEAKGKNNAWVPVTQVACDENQPYHDMYAVWGQSTLFYVFHSATGKLEAVNLNAMKDANKTTYNLKDAVTPGYLYGGYYTDVDEDGFAYGYLSVDTVKKLVKDLETKTTDSGWTPATASEANKFVSNIHTVTTTDYSAFRTYDGSALYTNGTDKAYAVDGEGKPIVEDGHLVLSPRVWKMADAETVNGTTLTPESGKVYYLKEVPESYLTSRLAWTYNNDAEGKPILDLYLLSVFDDNNYDSYGFYTVDGVSGTALASATTRTSDNHLAKTFTLVQRGLNGTGEPTAITIDGSRFGVSGGYVMVTKQTGMVSKAAFSMLPSWTTPDGIKVTNDPVGYTKITDFDAGGTTTEGYSWQRVYDDNETLYVNLGAVSWWQNRGDGYSETEETVQMVYFFGDPNQDPAWARLEKIGNTNVFVTTVPKGNWTNLILVRCNPRHLNAHPDDFWGAMWSNDSQTGDIPIPKSTDGNNVANISSNYIQSFSPNSATVTWATYPSN